METPRSEEIENFEFKKEVLTRLTKIETLISSLDLKKISEQSNEALRKSEENEKRIQKLEESNVWIVRTILASIITAILAVIFKFTK